MTATTRCLIKRLNPWRVVELEWHPSITEVQAQQHRLAWVPIFHHRYDTQAQARRVFEALPADVAFDLGGPQGALLSTNPPADLAVEHSNQTIIDIG